MAYDKNGKWLPEIDLSGESTQIGPQKPSLLAAAPAPSAAPIYEESGAAKKPSWAGDPAQMKAMRDADFAQYMKQMGGYFGEGSPGMKEILDARKAAAFGPDGETALARRAGAEGINRSVQTAMRQFAGSLPQSGVRGGAAGAMGGILARGAVDQTRGLERDLAINEMQRRREALGKYETSFTGERAGHLGGAFGMTGLGAQDRYGALGYLTAEQMRKLAEEERNAAANPLGGGGGGSMSWQDKLMTGPERAREQWQKVGPLGSQGGIFNFRKGPFGEDEGDANKYNPFQGGNNFAI